MSAFIDLTGHRFGRLVVLQRGENYSNGQTRWKCLCDCGIEVLIARANLVRNMQASCGCLKSRTGKDHPLFSGVGDISASQWQRIQSGADGKKRRPIEFSVTIEEAWQLFLDQGKKCALTGWDIDFGQGRRIVPTASLDRIDSSQGYKLNNIQWLHKDINRLKWDLSTERLVELCRAVVTYTQSS